MSFDEYGTEMIAANFTKTTSVTWFFIELSDQAVLLHSKHFLWRRIIPIRRYRILIFFFSDVVTADHHGVEERDTRSFQTDGFPQS